MWNCNILFTQVFACLYVGEPANLSCVAGVVSDIVEGMMHNTATVEDLKKIKQVGYDRTGIVSLLINGMNWGSDVH